jgi:putative methyltransferase (TIGR04325 family)
MSLEQLSWLTRRIVPPFLRDTVRWLRDRTRYAPSPEWEYVPEGWASADARITGWNVDSILETQQAKWPYFLRALNGTSPLGIAHEAPVPTNHDLAAHNTIMAYAYVLGLSAHLKSELSVLDWGGGVGHYYLIARTLYPELGLHYTCKDLPLLCRGGQDLLPGVVFEANAARCFARGYDLVMASSSLQYSENWRCVARKLAAVATSYLYVTRIPVVNHSDSFVVVQRPYQCGYQAEYLGWFLNRSELIEHLEGLGMRLVREFLIDEQPFVPHAPEQATYRGFLFRGVSSS